ncbi:hypothetical protein ACRRTK_008727 [Alexandromys fortis]
MGEAAMSKATFVLFALGEGWPCQRSPVLPVSARDSGLVKCPLRLRQQRDFGG